MRFFLLAMVVGGAVVGDLLKALAIRQHAAVEDFRPGALGRRLGLAFRTPRLWLSLAAYALSFFAFVGLVSVAEVSFAVPATAASYVIETALARWVLQETVSRARWAGAGVVAAGVVLLSV